MKKNVLLLVIAVIITTVSVFAQKGKKDKDEKITPPFYRGKIEMATVLMKLPSGENVYQASGQGGSALMVSKDPAFFNDAAKLQVSQYIDVQGVDLTPLLDFSKEKYADYKKNFAKNHKATSQVLTANPPNQKVDSAKVAPITRSVSSAKEEPVTLDTWLAFGKYQFYSITGYKVINNSGSSGKTPSVENSLTKEKEGETDTDTDSDGDGIPDHLDLEPYSTEGVRVDSDGKEVDSDGDGIPDSKDFQHSPKGAKVNKHGIAIFDSKTPDELKSEKKQASKHAPRKFAPTKTEQPEKSEGDPPTETTPKHSIAEETTLANVPGAGKKGGQFKVTPSGKTNGFAPRGTKFGDKSPNVKE